MGARRQLSGTVLFLMLAEDRLLGQWDFCF